MKNSCTLFQPGEFQFFADLIQRLCGISLAPDKEYLVLSRMEPIVNKNSFAGISELIDELKKSQSAQLESEVVEAMTTPETMFFRDTKFFNYFQQVMIPDLHKNAIEKGHLRFWSAASSTGQEAYSVGMSLLDNPASALWNYEIVGTDISSKVLHKASNGAYSAFEAQRGLSENHLKRHFISLPDDHFKVNDNLRKLATFSKHNLLDKFSHKALFDVILCRNVLIYFNETNKMDVVKRLYENLQPNGYLVLGGSEFISADFPMLKKLGDVPGVYQKTMGTT